MRTIKFRGIALDKNGQRAQMIYGDLNNFFSSRSAYAQKTTHIQYNHAEGVGVYEVDPETVGQFTGLLDKDGKEIYEGDVVRSIYEWESYEADGEGCIENSTVKKGAVVFEAGEWRVTKEILGLYKWDRKTLEVIGNIHDNPELIAPKVEPETEKQ